MAFKRPKGVALYTLLAGIAAIATAVTTHTNPHIEETTETTTFHFGGWGEHTLTTNHCTGDLTYRYPHPLPYFGYKVIKDRGDACSVPDGQPEYVAHQHQVGNLDLLAKSVIRQDDSGKRTLTLTYEENPEFHHLATPLVSGAPFLEKELERAGRALERAKQRAKNMAPSILPVYAGQ